MQENSEPELLWVQQIAQGDRDAFEKLYAAYRVRLFHYLFRMVGETGLAEELTTDVMVEAWKGAAKFRGESKASTWLLGIARHKALNELRRRRPVTVEVETATAVAASTESPEESVIHDHLQKTMKQAIGELSAEHREVVELAFYHELSYQEIAAIMECPVNTVKTRMFYARRRLQELLQGLGIHGETI
jgi:RNA polymerase sigma-70 factor (ECF subfamily)